MTRRILTVSILAIMTHLTTSCGSSSSSSGSSTAATPTSSTLSTDTDTSTSLVQNANTASITAMSAGENGASSAAFDLDEYGLTTTGSLTTTRACVTSGTTAVVTINYSGTASGTVGTYTTSETGSGSDVRTWSNSNNTVYCTKDVKYAKINWASATVGTGTSPASGVTGLSLSQTTTRSRNLVNTNSAGKTRTNNYTDSGTYNTSWSSLTSKSVYYSFTRTGTLSRYDGTQVDLGSTHTIPQSSPMTVTVTRDSAGAPLTYSQSGTIQVNNSGSYYIVTTLTGVTYSLSSSTPCTPTAGSEVVQIYKSNSSADTATPLKTLTVSFASGTPSVTVDSATSADATATANFIANEDKNCDLINKP